MYAEISAQIGQVTKIFGLRYSKCTLFQISEIIKVIKRIQEGAG